jgi:hypothetical protein
VHLTEVELDLLYHEELARRHRDVALAHVAQCTECASRHQRFAAEDREIADALGLLDHPVPKANVSALIGRAKRVRRTHRWRLAAAAGAFAFAMAGVAAAMPGSPIRALLHRARMGPSRAPAAAPQVALKSPPAAGISVGAGDTVVLIFEAAQMEGSIRITFRADSQLNVRATGGPARFTVRSGEVWVRNSGSAASYEIAVPSAARRVEMRVVERLVFAKHGSLVTLAPRRERDGSYIVRFDAAISRP